MVETVAAIVPFLTVAVGAGQVASGIAEARAARQAAQIEQQQADFNRKAAIAAADQEEAARRRELQRILASNEAIRAASGFTSEGGSADALRKENIRIAEADIATTRANRLAEAGQSALQGRLSAIRGRTGVLSGAVTALGGLARIGTEIPVLFPPPPKKPPQHHP